MAGTTTGSAETIGPPATTEHRGRGSNVHASKVLAAWLDARIPFLAELWLEELHAREIGAPGDHSELLRLFADRLLPALTHMVGSHRVQVESAWVHGFDLYGAVAARRGLAAGEAVEELHVLRELMIRDLHRDAAIFGGLPLRELLLLNRALDRAVTHASVGHTDALFFDLLEHSGGTSVVSGQELLEETEQQLVAIEEEVASLVGSLQATELASAVEN